jgi:hypothetical protein
MTVAEMLSRVPVKAVASEDLEDGRTVLLRPKFMGPGMGWLQRRLSRPVFRVRLDAKGTYIWSVMDGQRTVQGVCDAVREHFGAEAEPVEERTLALLHHMAAGEFIRLQEAGPTEGRE